MTLSASVINSVAHSFRIFLGSQKLPCLFNFPVSRARPENLGDFYWLQLRITYWSGWTAQAVNRYCVCKGGKVNLLRRGGQSQGCALTYGARSLDCKTVGFFSKSEKKSVKRDVRVLRERSARACTIPCNEHRSLIFLLSPFSTK